MSALTPRFKFMNIYGVEQASYSLSRGVQPSVCTVRLPLNPNVQKGPGEMSFSDGQRTVRFSECIVNDVAVEIDGDGGQAMVIAILDRRWKWKYGEISGVYNVVTGGEIQKRTKKSPRDLAKLLLEKLGETRYDISRMPNDTNPHVEWNLDKPAAMLAELCQSLNAHICLGYDDVIRIWPDGDGNELPQMPSSSSGLGFDFGAKPGNVGVASGLFAWELDLPLEPCGMDTDGQLKEIDKLSYRPKDGWEYVDPATMNGLQSDTDANVDERKLGKETVWRWYAIKIPKGLKTMPIARQKIVSTRQFFPLLDHQLRSEDLSEVELIATSAGSFDKTTKQKLPSQVWGLFYDEHGTGADNLPDFKIEGYIDLSKKKTDEDGKVKLVHEKLIYPKSFSVDNTRRIIVFSDPVYRIKDGKNIKPKLFLRTAVNFYHEETRAGFRLQKQMKVGGPVQNLIEWESREDLIPEWRQIGGGEQSYNGKDIEAGLNYYLQYAAKRYRSRIPGHCEMPYLLPYSPDGKIAQVTFGIDGEGFIATTINKEEEGLNSLVTYKERLQEVTRAATAERLRKVYSAGKQDAKRAT